MTTATRTVPTAEDRVQLARLTRVEYERRILLAAQRRRLDAIPDGELDDEDVWVEHSMSLLWAHAWEQLDTKQRAHDWMLDATHAVAYVLGEA